MCYLKQITCKADFKRLYPWLKWGLVLDFQVATNSRNTLQQVCLKLVGFSQLVDEFISSDDRLTSHDCD